MYRKARDVRWVSPDDHRPQRDRRFFSGAISSAGASASVGVGQVPRVGLELGAGTRAGVGLSHVGQITIYVDQIDPNLPF